MASINHSVGDLTRMKFKVFFLLALSSSALTACQAAPMVSMPLGRPVRQTAQSAQPAVPNSATNQNSARKPLSLDDELNLLSQVVRKSIFADRDLNHDQVLTREEFGPPLSAGGDEYEALFQQIDQNRDRRLSLQETLTGPPIHYTASIDSMKNFMEYLAEKGSLFGFDLNKDHKISRSEMETIANKPAMDPILKAFAIAEFPRRDLNQDQVLDLNEGKIFSMMFYYKNGMKDTQLPSEQTK